VPCTIACVNAKLLLIASVTGCNWDANQMFCITQPVPDESTEMDMSCLLLYQKVTQATVASTNSSVPASCVY
jgi:hypothetical protein